MVTGWTENCSIRNNAAKWITAGVEELQAMFPFPITIFDSVVLGIPTRSDFSAATCGNAAPFESLTFQVAA
jgi:hypothetical protein